MYLSRPPISPNAAKQLQPKNTNSQAQKATVEAPVKELDNSVRHPVTQQWLSRYQNKQSPAVDAPTTRRKGE